METTQESSQRIEAALASLAEERKQLQEMETRNYQEWKQRLEMLVALFAVSEQTRLEFEREAAEDAR